MRFGGLKVLSDPTYSKNIKSKNAIVSIDTSDDNNYDLNHSLDRLFTAISDYFEKQSLRHFDELLK